MNKYYLVIVLLIISGCTVQPYEVNSEGSYSFMPQKINLKIIDENNNPIKDAVISINGVANSPLPSEFESGQISSSQTGEATFTITNEMYFVSSSKECVKVSNNEYCRVKSTAPTLPPPTITIQAAGYKTFNEPYTYITSCFTPRTKCETKAASESTNVTTYVYPVIVLQNAH